MHSHLTVFVRRELALTDQPVDKVDRAQLLQQAAVETDLVNPVLDFLLCLRRALALYRIDLDHHDVAALPPHSISMLNIPPKPCIWRLAKSWPGKPGWPG